MNTGSMSIPIRDMVYAAIYAAVLCVVAPFSINIGPIPISFATLVIYLAAGSLGWKHGLAAVVIYVGLGAIGLPVFTNFEGGFYKIAGMTGGFIVGYIPLALMTGLFADLSKGSRVWHIFGMAIGTILLYACGVAWFMLQSGASFATALMACVIPFLIGDSMKIAISAIIAPQLRSALLRSKPRSF